MGMVNAIVAHEELESTAYQLGSGNSCKISDFHQDAKICHESDR